MSDAADINTTKSTRKWISKIFRTKSGSDARSDSASMVEPLVAESEDPIKANMAHDHHSFAELMEQAKAMDPGDFRKFLQQYRDEQEKQHHQHGGGIAGGGDWVSRNAQY
ncbi:hypothetical protein PV05_07138 [Exophiala xenobiotica]|uniref:Uncharacterized protein n=1 Tax=Exophiala xenobiotica TaxID=348802 RepID=A0A0D2EH99_9EURO|nr:uncharacterized protein PV05_07138 [Exophiala xenobiotica]KIW54803.1 hypothetical protein PV05_07138 [Exophiala xenobiotica]